MEAFVLVEPAGFLFQASFISRIYDHQRLDLFGKTCVARYNMPRLEGIEHEGLIHLS